MGAVVSKTSSLGRAAALGLIGAGVGWAAASLLTPPERGHRLSLQERLQVDGIAAFQVDAFADKVFTGNPAGVVVYEPTHARMRGMNEAWMAQFARELDLPMCAFVALRRTIRTVTSCDIRWFSAAGEGKLCGHATLATAHVLFASGLVPSDVTLPLRSRFAGTLLARCSDEGEVALDFPNKQCSERELLPASVLRAIGVSRADVRFTGANDLDALIEVSSAAVVEACSLDQSALVDALGDDLRCVIVTAHAPAGLQKEGKEVSFVSRVFGKAGEDPVTGSAHCCLGPYWAPKLLPAEEQDRPMFGFQASERTGLVRVRTLGPESVELCGTAVTVVGMTPAPAVLKW